MTGDGTGRVKRIVILGSTGSIGRNCLKVVDAFPNRFRIVGLAAGSDFRTLAEQAARYRPLRVAVADGDAASRLRARLGRGRTTVEEGAEAVAGLAELEEADVVVSAIVGSAGLLPTWRAVAAGKTVALANKETLVMAGGLLMAEAARSGAVILPVDSEHHAIATALGRVGRDAVTAVTLTASGGPFLDTPASKLRRVTVRQALRHPRWRMGSKISIDSATLVNKGLEIIEAHWLFGFAEDRIRVTVHPESIIHGMIHLADGGCVAYLSRPDMRLPIAAALNHPRVLDQGLGPVDLEKLGRLTFRAPDYRRFPALLLARQALREGGCVPAAFNAANEVAVAAFLSGRLGFTDIAAVIEATLAGLRHRRAESIEAVLGQDALARRKAGELVLARSRRLPRCSPC